MRSCRWALAVALAVALAAFSAAFLAAAWATARGGEGFLALLLLLLLRQAAAAAAATTFPLRGLLFALFYVRLLELLGVQPAPSSS